MLRRINHFKSGYFNCMDHTQFWGIEPSSVIFSIEKYYNLMPKTYAKIIQSKQEV